MKEVLIAAADLDMIEGDYVFIAMEMRLNENRLNDDRIGHFLKCKYSVSIFLKFYILCLQNCKDLFAAFRGELRGAAKVLRKCDRKHALFNKSH